MTKVTRRNVLKGGTALVGGMAGILATGRAPAFAQGTTVQWLRWNDFVPASDQLLRKELLPAAEKALGSQDQSRDRERQRPAAAHHLGDSVGLRSRHHHALQQPPADLFGERHRPFRHRRPGGQGRRWLLRSVQIELGRRSEMDRPAVDHRRRHDRLPKILVRRGRLHRPSPTHGRSIARLARSSKPRAGRSARRLATLSATRRRSATPICGRGAAARSRRTAKPSTSTRRRSSSPSSS